jgi:hypothetical protein
MSRALSRWAIAGVLAIAAPLVSACDYLDDVASWNKKPLTGERKSLFPNGVPGVATGVPADVVKGYSAPEGQIDPASAAAEAAAAEPAKPRPKPQAAKPPAPPTAQQATAQTLSSAKPAKRQAAAKPATSPQADPKAAPARQAATPASAAPASAASAAQSSGLPGATPLPWPTQPVAR